MKAVYEGTYTFITLVSTNGLLPIFSLTTKRIVIRDDRLYRELAQWHMLKLSGYRPRILYGINCNIMR